MNDDKKRPPRFARRTVNVPPATRVDGEGAEKNRTKDAGASDKSRPRYAGYVPSPGDAREQDEVRAGASYGKRPFVRGEQEIDLPPENLLLGRNPIREALKSGAPVEKLIVSDGDLSGAARDIIQLAREKGVIVQKVSRQRLDMISTAHQGMAAYVAAASYSTVEEILACAKERGEDPFLVILDGVTDPHNLGAVIRSAECAGAHGVIIPERRASGLTPAAAKAAAGALSYIKVARVKNLNRTIDELKEAGVWAVAAALEGEDAFTADLTGPIALVVGSEGEGISHLTLEKCDRRVTLPMKGQIGSLNASVAAGILIYEVMRARARA